MGIGSGDAGEEVPLFLYPSPIFAFETIIHVRVDKNVVRLVVDVHGTEANVFDKCETGLLEPNVVDNVGHNKPTRSSLIVETLSKFQIQRVSSILNQFQCTTMVQSDQSRTRLYATSTPVSPVNESWTPTVNFVVFHIEFPIA